jgi:hypothetical protein
MHRARAFPLVLIALYVQQAAAVHAQACVADQHGGLVCGEGKAAMRVVADTTSPSKEYAFAWRSEQGPAVRPRSAAIRRRKSPDPHQ